MKSFVQIFGEEKRLSRGQFVQLVQTDTHSREVFFREERFDDKGEDNDRKTEEQVGDASEHENLQNLVGNNALPRIIIYS